MALRVGRAGRVIVWMSVGAVPGTLLEGQNWNSARILNWAARPKEQGKKAASKARFRPRVDG